MAAGDKVLIVDDLLVRDERNTSFPHKISNPSQ
jgi:hypothetical protein